MSAQHLGMCEQCDGEESQGQIREGLILQLLFYLMTPYSAVGVVSRLLPKHGSGDTGT